MHIGTAIFVVAIIGFMIFSPGFRVMLAWLAAAVVGIVILLYAANTFSEYQAKERARIEAEKVEQRRKIEAEKLEQQRLKPSNWSNSGSANSSLNGERLR